ncbi:OmpA family protein [Gymnodinialimonas sp. 2305UL16-5]|uniref:OmpA family protein n=1 Tax=Gymnodinialimonas mytili TaxID=3126503 RepID=UPI0030A14E45
MTSIGHRIPCRTAILCVTFYGLLSPVVALELDFAEGASLVLNTQATDSAHPIATDRFVDGAVPTRLAEGAVREFVWHTSGASTNAASLAENLRQQLIDQGYEIAFSCNAINCGGFDFRHALPVGNAPEMHVDLGNFFYLAGTRDGEDGPEDVALMVSQGGSTGFVHMALVQPNTGGDAPPTIHSTRTPDAAPDIELTLTPAGDGNVISRLVEDGAAPLDDLQFGTGASTLSGRAYGSLTALAEFLAEDPERRVVLVGHTDFTGSLNANIAVSEARAAAVRDYLTGSLGVNPAQIRAEGIGFLSPRANNTTEAGRETNRRVEVVLEDPGQNTR